MIRARQAGMQSGGCSIAVEQKQEEAQHPLPLLGDGLADGCAENSLPLCYNLPARARLEEEQRRQTSRDVTGD